MSLTASPKSSWRGRDLPAARMAVAEAQELVFSEADLAVCGHENWTRSTPAIGRGAMRAARPAGALVEELTDRELTVLRMLSGTANQREIGAALFLSINTVKGYAKSLYRKLDVSTRHEAVQRGHELNLI